MSELVKAENNNIHIKLEIVDELNNLLKPYTNKNVLQLEKIVDSTQPFLEAKEFKNPIKLDNYAYDCASIIAYLKGKPSSSLV